MTPSSSLLCARGFLSANPARGLNGTSALTAAASATNAAEAEEITQDLAHGPRALPQSQTKGLCLGSSPLSLSLHRRIWLRPLTVKLNGRAEAPEDRKSTRLNSSHRCTSYAVHCFTYKRWLEDALIQPTVRA